MTQLVLVGGTIHPTPDADPIRDGVVLVDGDRIAHVGGGIIPTATMLDCAGLHIAAGFWNSHVHFFERKWAGAATMPAPELARRLTETFLRFGFTTVFDLGSPLENTRQLRARIASGEVTGPRILSTGEGLLPPGGAPPDAVLGVMGVVKMDLPEVANASQAADAARRLLDAGADGIKLFASTPRGARLADGVMHAAVSEARRAGKPVFVHPNSAADVEAALRAGVDVIAHTTPRDVWPAAIRPLHGAALTPTLSLWKFFSRHERASEQDRIVAASLAQLRAWREAGGAVLFGTDLGAVDPDPSEEYALMSAAGMSFRDILTSLTTAPAARFGASARLAVGERADITVFGDDFADVRYTLRGGKISYRAPRDLLQLGKLRA